MDVGEKMIENVDGRWGFSWTFFGESAAECKYAANFPDVDISRFLSAEVA